MAGWVDSFSSHCRVLLTSMPLRCRARISSCGESGFKRGCVQQPAQFAGQLLRALPGGGRRQGAGRGSLPADRSCRSSRQGHPRAAFRRRSWPPRIRQQAAGAAGCAGSPPCRPAPGPPAGPRIQPKFLGLNRGVAAVPGSSNRAPWSAGGGGGSSALGGSRGSSAGVRSAFRIVRVGGELRESQDVAAQGQVVAALQLDAGGEQRRVPVLGAVPDPAGRACLCVFESADDGGQFRCGDQLRFRIGWQWIACLGEFLQGRAVGVGGEQQVHAPIVPCPAGLPIGGPGWGAAGRRCGRVFHIGAGAPAGCVHFGGEWLS